MKKKKKISGKYLCIKKSLSWIWDQSKDQFLSCIQTSWSLNAAENINLFITYECVCVNITPFFHSHAPEVTPTDCFVCPSLRAYLFVNVCVHFYNQPLTDLCHLLHESLSTCMQHCQVFWLYSKNVGFTQLPSSNDRLLVGWLDCLSVGPSELGIYKRNTLI